MTLVVRVNWLQMALVLAGASLLGYCGFTAIDAWWFQRSERAAFAERVATIALLAEKPRTLEEDGVIGRLDVERLGISVMVLEGTAAKTLRRAAGHIAGTALPGARGNVGISGHRDTFFYPLRNIRRDDVVSVTTGSGRFSYRVVSVTVVAPSDTAVLDGNEKQVLTLVTCYPFRFIGSAPERFIVRAERVT